MEYSVSGTKSQGGHATGLHPMGASAGKGGCGDEHLRSQDGHGKVGDGSKVKGNGAVDSHRLIKESIIGCMDLWASCDIFF